MALLYSRSQKEKVRKSQITLLHAACFGEAMELLRQKLNQKNVYFMNPAFDL